MIRAFDDIKRELKRIVSPDSVASASAAKAANDRITAEVMCSVLVEIRDLLLLQLRDTNPASYKLFLEDTNQVSYDVEALRHLRDEDSDPFSSDDPPGDF